MSAEREKSIGELSRPGQRCAILPRPDVPETAIPESLVRAESSLPELDEAGIEAHYSRLRDLDAAASAQGGLPAFHGRGRGHAAREAATLHPGFLDSHAFLPDSLSQGSIELAFRLQSMLGSACGFDACSLDFPSMEEARLAGALMTRSMREASGSAVDSLLLLGAGLHGMGGALGARGFETADAPLDPAGGLDLPALDRILEERPYDLMVAFPEASGRLQPLFGEAFRMTKASGGAVFADLSSARSLAGILRPADLGVDIACLDIGKCFSPSRTAGGGALLARAELSSHFPGRVALRDSGGECRWACPGGSAAAPGPFRGDVAQLVRAYVAMLMLGAAGLRQGAEAAALNSAYLKAMVAREYPIAAGEGGLCAFLIGARELRGLSAGEAAAILAQSGAFSSPAMLRPLSGDSLLIEPGEEPGPAALEAQAQALMALARGVREGA
jgi:glycine cleavage system protein P-like pyridoxal-binding family